MFGEGLQRFVREWVTQSKKSSRKLALDAWKEELAKLAASIEGGMVGDFDRSASELVQELCALIAAAHGSGVSAEGLKAGACLRKDCEEIVAEFREEFALPSLLATWFEAPSQEAFAGLATWLGTTIKDNSARLDAGDLLAGKLEDQVDDTFHALEGRLRQLNLTPQAFSALQTRLRTSTVRAIRATIRLRVLSRKLSRAAELDEETAALTRVVFYDLALFNGSSETADGVTGEALIEGLPADIQPGHIAGNGVLRASMLRIAQEVVAELRFAKATRLWLANRDECAAEEAIAFLKTEVRRVAVAHLGSVQAPMLVADVTKAIRANYRRLVDSICEYEGLDQEQKELGVVFLMKRFRGVCRGIQSEVNRRQLLHALAQGGPGTVPEWIGPLLRTEMGEIAIRSYLQSKSLPTLPEDLVEQTLQALSGLSDTPLAPLSKPVRQVFLESAREVSREFHPGTTTVCMLEWVTTGSARAENQFYDRMYKRLEEMVYRLGWKDQLRDAQRTGYEELYSAGDVIAELYVRTMSGYAVSWPNTRSFLAWATKAVHNILCDWSRRRKARQPEAGPLIPLPEIEDAGPDRLEIHGGRIAYVDPARPLDSVSEEGFSFTVFTLKTVLDDLEEDCRQNKGGLVLHTADALRLWLGRKLPVAEIADELGFSLAKTKRILERGLLVLQHRIVNLAWDFDDEIHFGNFKTFGWHPKQQCKPGSPLADAQRAIELQLKRRGLQRIDDVPDLWVSLPEVQAIPRDETARRVNTLSFGYELAGNRQDKWAAVLGALGLRQPLIIDLLRAEDNRWVWRALCSGVFADPKEFAARLEKAVERAFRCFPPETAPSMAEIQGARRIIAEFHRALRDGQENNVLVAAERVVAAVDFKSQAPMHGLLTYSWTTHDGVGDSIRAALDAALSDEGLSRDDGQPGFRIEASGSTEAIPENARSRWKDLLHYDLGEYVVADLIAANDGAWLGRLFLVTAPPQHAGGAIDPSAAVKWVASRVAKLASKDSRRPERSPRTRPTLTKAAWRVTEQRIDVVVDRSVQAGRMRPKDYTCVILPGDINPAILKGVSDALSVVVKRLGMSEQSSLEAGFVFVVSSSGDKGVPLPNGLPFPPEPRLTEWREFLAEERNGALVDAFDAVSRQWITRVYLGSALLGTPPENRSIEGALQWAFDAFIPA